MRFSAAMKQIHNKNIKFSSKFIWMWSSGNGFFCKLLFHDDDEDDENVRKCQLTFSSEIPWFTRRAIPLVLSAFANWTATRFITDFTGHSSIPSARRWNEMMKINKKKKGIK